MKVGFIGLGHMGTGMAMNLIKAGHEVTVYNRTPEKARALAAAGARLARRVSDASQGDAVMTMLANDEAVESVVFRVHGPDDFIHSTGQLSSGAVDLIDIGGRWGASVQLSTNIGCSLRSRASS